MTAKRPKVSGGYIDVPRYLFDAFLAAPGLSGILLRVVLAIVRLTWGYYPEKHAGGARISHQTIAKRAGVGLQTVHKAMRRLKREGVVEEVAPPVGRRAAVIRVNPDTAKWGRFVPVECPASDTHPAVECPARDTLREPVDNSAVECPMRTPLSDPTGTPGVSLQGHSTASPILPSLKLPSFKGQSGLQPSQEPEPAVLRPSSSGAVYCPDCGFELTPDENLVLHCPDCERTYP